MNFGKNNCFDALIAVFAVILLITFHAPAFSSGPIKTVLSVNQTNSAPEISYDFDPAQWYHIAYTKPVSGVGEIFVNGVSIGVIIWDALPYNHYIINIGATYDKNYMNFFEGTIDEIRISNTIRTQSELLNVYQADQPFQNDGFTLQIWKFDEGAGEEFYNVNNDLIGDVVNEPEWVDGKFGKAIKYDGIDDRLRVNYDVPEYGVTYEIWVKFDGEVKDTPQTIIQPYGTHSIELTIQQQAESPVGDQEVTIQIGNVLTNKNNNISTPVTVRDFANILTTQGTISWDPELLTFQNTTNFGLPDLDEDAFYLFEPGKLTYSWNPSDLQPVTVDDDSEIFSIDFKVIGDPGKEADIAFSDDPTVREVGNGEDEVLTVVYEDGKVTIQSEVVCSGYIRTQNGGAIANVEVTLSGGKNDVTYTDENGLYSFSVIPNQTYHIQPVLEVETDDAVTTLDLVIMHWHILGQKYIMSNYDLIACDVNESKSLTTLDVAETRAVILHMENQFKDRKAVEFVNYTYTGSPNQFDYKNYIEITPDEDDNGLNFTAVKLGDAGGNWNPNNSGGGRYRQLEEIELILEKEQLGAHKVKIPIKSNGFSGLVGLQFTLEWNPKAYGFERLSGQLLDFNSNLKQVEEGKLTVSWNSEDMNGLSFNEGSICSYVEFEILNDNEDPKIGINSSLTPALAFNSSLETFNVRSRFDLEERMSSKKLSIYPNPAKDYIKIIDRNRSFEKYSILNTAGTVLTSGDTGFDTGIKIDHLKKGMYLLRIVDKHDQVTIKKFMKL